MDTFWKQWKRHPDLNCKKSWTDQNSLNKINIFQVLVLPLISSFDGLLLSLPPVAVAIAVASVTPVSVTIGWKKQQHKPYTHETITNIQALKWLNA